MPRRKEKKGRGDGGRDDDNVAERLFCDSVESDSSNRKYGRRPIQSNWVRYESAPSPCADEVKSDDFNSLVNTSSDCDYFQFKSEKKWENEALRSRFSGHKLFNLDLELLAKALACVPFYDRVDVDKKRFSSADVERCAKKAEESRSVYDLYAEKYTKVVEKGEGTHFGETITGDAGVNDEVTDKAKIARGSCNSENRHCDGNKLPHENVKVNEKKEELLVKNEDVKDNISHKVINKKNENLEDWLDSILDD